MKEFHDEVRERLRIEDVIELADRRGSRALARCPFCPAPDPSGPTLAVDIAKQLFYCFKCAEVGDVITFAMKRAGTSFVKATHDLAKRCGIDPESVRKRLSGELDELRGRLSRESDPDTAGLLMAEAVRIRRAMDDCAG